jgi:hypothetical protein
MIPASDLTAMGIDPSGRDVYQNVYQVLAFGCISLHMIKREIDRIQPNLCTGCINLHPQ